MQKIYLKYDEYTPPVECDYGFIPEMVYLGFLYPIKKKNYKMFYIMLMTEVAVSTLIMYFIDGAGNKSSISIEDPKPDLIAEEVQSAMESLIEDSVLLGTKGTSLVQVHSAHIVTRTVDSLMI